MCKEVGAFALCRLGYKLRLLRPQAARQHRMMNLDAARVFPAQRMALSPSRIAQVLAGDQARSVARTQLTVSGGWLNGHFAALDEFRTGRHRHGRDEGVRGPRP
jgi:hypothetical protein